ncbi:MAG: winged helix-turn-helix domain-containing protein [Alphaproteobacteria bacterium]|nr:winged helix-turn-helix domain-containing protein [Alphaproteobacteria bacterium]
MRFEFGPHVLDVDRRELRRNGVLIEVEPQVHDLLAYLVAHRDRVVSKDDLLADVWGGRIVSESALSTRINAARRILGDDGAAQRLIRTLPRRGWRFVGEVREPVASDGADEPTPAGLINWAGGIRATLAIVFTDLVGFMHLSELLNDEDLARMMRIHFSETWKYIQLNNGWQIKTLGDGVLAVFRSVEAALDFAWAIHIAPGDQKLKVRAGINIGSVLITGHDITGSAVNVASRLTGQIKDAGIWLSDEAYQHLLSSRLPHHAHFIWRKHEGIEIGELQKTNLWSLANKITI